MRVPGRGILLPRRELRLLLVEDLRFNYGETFRDIRIPGKIMQMDF
jgi:hypothetical protein